MRKMRLRRQEGQIWRFARKGVPETSIGDVYPNLHG